MGFQDHRSSHLFYTSQVNSQSRIRVKLNRVSPLISQTEAIDRSCFHRLYSYGKSKSRKFQRNRDNDIKSSGISRSLKPHLPCSDMWPTTSLEEPQNAPATLPQTPDTLKLVMFSSRAPDGESNTWCLVRCCEICSPLWMNYGTPVTFVCTMWLQKIMFYQKYMCWLPEIRNV